MLRPYKVEIMKHFWSIQTPMDSRTVHEHLLSVEGEGARSRASVITFLNWMVDEGFLDFEEKSTKGGYKRIYRLNSTSIAEGVFKVHVANRFQLGLFQFKQTPNQTTREQ